MSAPSFTPRACDHFAPVYADLVRSVVSEPASPVVRPTVRERVLRCLWFDQEFEDALRTESGEKLTVLSPGWWNLESGPDFRHAALRFGGGKARKGDVETHIYASGWTQHKHDEDPAYDNVILHVVLWNDTGRETMTRHDGAEVPTLALDRYVSRRIDDLSETVNPEEYPHASAGNAGRCQELVHNARIDPDWVGQFLDHAGDERMLRKATRFGEMPESADPESLLYVSLMEAAGFKSNKKPMRRLAQLVPLGQATRLLGERGVMGVQAALFGMAALLPEQMDLPGAESDAETSGYVAALREQWGGLRASLEGTPLEPTAWKLGGTRPTNYPVRRIAGIARLLERSVESGGLISSIERELRRAPATPSRRIARSPAAKAVIDLLAGLSDPYWSRRTSFGGRRLRSETKLFGAARAAEMFVDAMVPIVLNYARSREDRDLENRLHRAYATLPPLGSNSVLSFMASRVFGGDSAAAAIVNSARRQQGLIQLFRDYCEVAEGCRRCAFARALEGN